MTPHTPDPRDAEIAALTAENAALNERLARKDEVLNTTVDAALMMLDPVREQLVAALQSAESAIETSEDQEPQMIAALSAVQAALTAAGAAP